MGNVPQEVGKTVRLGMENWGAALRLIAMAVVVPICLICGLIVVVRCMPATAWTTLGTVTAHEPAAFSRTQLTG